jgi:steroid delta-isomerase-like uncharacterized protein
MTGPLVDRYLGYIECLNSQDWEDLGAYVGDDVEYNGQRIGLTAYRQAREDEFRDIPDLVFTIALLVADERTVASRLDFEIRPRGEFMGLPVNGRRISFSENVFYEFESGKIGRVWSVIDRSAIEAQLRQI